MAKLYNLARMTTATTSTGTITLGAAVSGYLSFAGAGVSDGDVIAYGIKDGASSEVGTGTYTSAGTTLTRTVTTSTNSNAAINLSGSAEVFITPRAQDFPPISGFLFGCTLSTAGSSASFSVASGTAANSTGIDSIVLGSSITKTTAAWAVGTGNGSFDGTGTGPSSQAALFAVFIIKRPDTGVVDILTSLSATTPTLPANYTLSRRIGWLRTNGSFQWIQFDQQGDYFFWTTTILDLSNSAIGTSRQLVSLSTPPNSIALLRVYMFCATATGIVIQRTSETDAAVSFSVAPLNNLYTESTNQGASGDFEVFADASSQFAVRSGQASTTVRVVSRGWIDTRGRLS